jgi:hypothetical protein
MQPLRVRIPATFYFSHAPPINFRGISVLLVAGHNAALATDAFRHVKVKAVLLSRLQRTVWNPRFAQVTLRRIWLRPAGFFRPLLGQQKSFAIFFCLL